MVNMSSLDDASAAWIWVIEYLANVKQIDMSMLHDLVEATPELSDDLGENARETIALRCLEDLFSPSQRLDIDKSSNLGTKVEFDLSESCENVLQNILKQASLSDLKMGGPQLLKWDVLPFIKHKRAGMPKCALKRLKEEIYGGTDLYAASLKERSELLFRNEGDKMIVNSSDHKVQMSRFDGSGNSLETLADSNFVPLAPEKRISPSGNDPRNEKLLFPIRNESDCATDSLLSGQCYRDQTSAIDDEKLHRSSNKRKQDATCAHQSSGMISIPLSGRGNDDGLTIKKSSCANNDKSQNDKIAFAHDKLTEVTNHDSPVCIGAGNAECGDVNDENCSTKNKLRECSCANNDKSQSNEIDIAHPGDKLTEVTNHDSPVRIGAENAERMDVSDDKSQNSEMEVTRHDLKKGDIRVCNFTMDGTDNVEKRTLDGEDSIDGAADDHRRYSVENVTGYDTDEHDMESNDFTEKKSQIFSSLCTSTENYLSTNDWTEQKICVKCKKADNLLVCNTNNCPFVVHENCIVLSAHLDERGIIFYCPFCAYSRAISVYLNAKEETSKARKVLAAFLCKLKSREMLRKGQSSHSRQLEDKGSFHDVAENEDLERKGNSPARKDGEDVKEVYASKLLDNIGRRRLPSTLSS